MGTIQFTTDIHSCLPQLKEFFSSIDIPQAKPLSPGEVLGCTSPILKGRDVLVFVADGRFHLEVCPVFFQMFFVRIFIHL